MFNFISINRELKQAMKRDGTDEQRIAVFICNGED